MTEASPHQQLDGMITGYWISQAIYAAAKFGIADHLKDGSKSVDELAEALQPTLTPFTGCCGP